MFDEPVRPLVLLCDVKTAAEDTAGFENPENFPKGSFLIGKGMDTIEGQHQIEATILKGQRTYISLPELYIGKSHFLCPVPGNFHHVSRIIQTGNVSMGQCFLYRHG